MRGSWGCRTAEAGTCGAGAAPGDPIHAREADLLAVQMAGRAGQIQCPTFVSNAEGDDISASAPQLAAALTGPKKFVTFTAAEGAGDHCEAGARTLFHARAFAWLDQLLQPR